MKQSRWCFVSIALVVAFALLSVACGNIRQAAQRSQNRNDLMQIALAYTNYCDTYQKGPAKAEDLLPYIENNNLLLQKMKSDYTIIWGVNLNDLKQFADKGTFETVLGYESAAPTAGGLVVMCSGEVKNMTAAEFNAAPKAKSGGDKGK
jgi:hypothetical protein